HDTRRFALVIPERDIRPFFFTWICWPDLEGRRLEKNFTRRLHFATQRLTRTRSQHGACRVERPCGAWSSGRIKPPNHQAKTGRVREFICTSRGVPELAVLVVAYSTLFCFPAFSWSIPIYPPSAPGFFFSCSKIVIANTSNQMFFPSERSR